LKIFIERIASINRVVFKAPSKLNVLEYAKKHVILPQEFANPPGYYSSDRKRWQEDMLLAVTKKKCVVAMIGSQMGKSVFQLLTLCYFVDQKPSPILVVVPNDKMAADFSISRFTPTIKASNLYHLFKREEDDSNTTLFKKYTGGIRLWR